MNPKTIDIVKSTAPLIQENGKQITQRMYEIAFNERPDYRRYFENTWMQTLEDGRRQAGRLAGAIYAYASHIDNLEELGTAVEHIANIHVNSKITAEHYPLIGKCLLAAIKDILGEAATPEVIEAWGEAYENLASIFIAREQEIYREKNDDLFAVEKSRCS